MFRRLTTSLESCSAVQGTVLDTSNDIVLSFRYGDDGRSPFVVEHERMRVPSPSPHCPRTPTLDADLQRHVDAVTRLFPDASTRTFDVPVSVRRVLEDAAHRTFTDADTHAPTVDEIASAHAAYAGNEFLGHWLRLHLHPYATAGLSPAALRWARAEVDRRLYKSRLSDGEPVGHLCASAISAAATQFTLNSFHNIGGGTGSYAGLEETINLNKMRKQPVARFRLLPHAQTRVADWVRAHKRVTLRDVVLERGTPKPGDGEVLRPYWEFPDRRVEGFPERFRPCMRLEVRADADPFAVRLALDACTPPRHVAYAPRPDGTHLFHIDVPITTNDLDTVVSGSIEGCRVDKDGTVTCARLSNVERFSDDIDMTTLYTNNFHETRERLGVEAARACMVSEMKRMLRTFGVSMQDRHVQLVADRCTSTGALLGCTRHGIFRRDPSRVLHSSAFEQHTQVLANAAAAGAVDPLKGPQERQVMGQCVKIGTQNPWLDVLPDPDAGPPVLADPSPTCRKTRRTTLTLRRDGRTTRVGGHHAPKRSPCRRKMPPQMPPQMPAQMQPQMQPHTQAPPFDPWAVPSQEDPWAAFQ